MSLVTNRQCDVFKTLRNIKKFRVVVERLMLPSEDIEQFDVTEWVDLSPRALVRLQRRIDRGLQPPSIRVADLQSKWVGPLLADVDDSKEVEHGEG
jgi:hypothetical protein